jgi:hypothetical protein
MSKPILVGAGFGLLALALMAGGFWITGNAYRTNIAIDTTSARSDASASQRGGAPTLPAVAPATPQPRNAQATQERRKRMSELRAELNALRAQGANAPPEKVLAIVDQMEALSSPGFDPRYFQTLRNMLDAQVRIRALNEELQALSKSSAPKNADRQEQILAEMRVQAERVTTEARQLQGYVATPPASAKAP